MDILVSSGIKRSLLDILNTLVTAIDTDVNEFEAQVLEPFTGCHDVLSFMVVVLIGLKSWILIFSVWFLLLAWR